MKATEITSKSPYNDGNLVSAGSPINQHSVSSLENATIKTEPKASFQNYTVNQMQDPVLKERIQNLRNVPEVFCCPVTFEIMKDPCINDSGSGHSYERSVLQEILEKGDKLDPISRQSFTIILQNRTLKEAIEEWKKHEFEFMNNEAQTTPTVVQQQAEVTNFEIPINELQEDQQPINNEIPASVQPVIIRTSTTAPDAAPVKPLEKLGDKLEAKIDKLDDGISKVTKKLEHSFKKRFRF